MNFFEKSNNKENKKEAFAKISSSSPEGVLLIENLPGNQTLEVSLDELRAGGLEKIAQLLRPEDLAAIMLMLRAADQQVLLAQVDGAIPVQVSNLEPLAKITESSGDVSVKRAGQVLTLKVGDSVLAGDEVMAMAKSVSLQVIGRSGEAGPVVKLSGVVQFSMTATAPDAPSKVLIAVSEGPVAVLGSALAQQSVVVSTPAGSVASSGGGAGYGVSVSDSGVPEADLAKVFYQEQGVDMGRVTLEGGSRTTRENACQVGAWLGPRCQESWLLVKSAWHMPRAIARDEGNCRNGQLRPWLQSKLICAQHSSGGLGEAVWRLKK